MILGKNTVHSRRTFWSFVSSFHTTKSKSINIRKSAILLHLRKTIKRLSWVVQKHFSIENLLAIVFSAPLELIKHVVDFDGLQWNISTIGFSLIHQFYYTSVQNKKILRVMFVWFHFTTTPNKASKLNQQFLRKNRKRQQTVPLNYFYRNFAFFHG